MTEHLLFYLDPTTYPTLTLNEPKEHKVIFKVDDKEPLILTKDGFYYNEQFIEDAGLAYKLFLERVK
jgi:hypothetical protein